MLNRISRATLADQVAQNLVDFIAAQELKPGDSLPSETKLAEQLGVSRPIIREALKTLVGRGIIETVSGKGAVVRPLDSLALSYYFERAISLEEQSVLDLMEVRQGLEVRSAVLAAERRTPDELAKMQDIVSEMSTKLHDFAVYADHDVALHLEIAAATHNLMLFNLIESIRESLKNSILEGLRRRRTDEQLKVVQGLHEAVVEAIEKRDPKAAGQAMTEHFEDAVMAFMVDDGEQESSD